MNKKSIISIFLAILILSVGVSAKAKPIDTFEEDVADGVADAFFDSLLETISDFENVLSKGQLNSLDKKIENAKSAYGREQPCTAVNILGAFLNETEALDRRDENGPIIDLYTEGEALRELLISLPGGENCLPNGPNDGNDIILVEDQTSNLGGSWPSPDWCEPGVSLSQSFTPTKSSLAAVSLGLESPVLNNEFVYPTTINILNPDGDVIIGTTITVDVTPPTNEQETLFQFSSPINVTPGLIYVIEWWVQPSVEIKPPLGWVIFNFSTYDGGNSFDCSGDPKISKDFIFTTWAEQGTP